ESKLVEALKPSFEHFEGRSPWLYLDHLGHLTVGIGHLVHRKGTPEHSLKQGIKAIWTYGLIQLRSNKAFGKEMATQCHAVVPVPKNGPASAKSYAKTHNAAFQRLSGLPSFKSLLERLDQDTGELRSATANDSSVPGVWGFDLANPEAPAANLTTLIKEAKQIEKL